MIGFSKILIISNVLQYPKLYTICLILLLDISNFFNLGKSPKFSGNLNI